LCEVLRWPVAEAAELLESTAAAINSALQRARATLKSVSPESTIESLDPADAALLERYVDAFQRYDIEGLVSLLREDAVQSMPPFAMWIQGAENIGRWMVESGPSACRGSRLMATTANGCPAFGQYRRTPTGGYEPWALQVLEITGGRIVGMQFFLAPLDPERLFPQFGLPLHLVDEACQPEQLVELGHDLGHDDPAAPSPRLQGQPSHLFDGAEVGCALAPDQVRGDGDAVRPHLGHATEESDGVHRGVDGPGAGFSSATPLRSMRSGPGPRRSK
ncbi:MAG: nuclear transport factor 2 family protein, partial [Acidimicrobiales bacterium]